MEAVGGGLHVGATDENGVLRGNNLCFIGWKGYQLVVAVIADITQDS